jgi:hypothetical protein
MGARAFVTWLSERGWKPEPVGKWTTDEEQATEVAMAAVSTTLTGGNLGIIADEDMARFNGSFARAEALGGSGAELTSSVLAVAANERLAAVAVRTRADAGNAFGIVHSLVILRRLTDRWQVLQVTPSVGTVELASRFAQLRLACRVVDEVAGVGEVSLASPVDGESRVSPFELWWDNGAGAQLLIVEWQQPVEGPPSRLYFLPDREPREKTRIVSPFGGGGLRWRVWAIGKGGALTLSRWRDMR